ncbi:hypothetical protein [Massilia sp. DWR3-1-1]|uniref:hypothetical protein n=1 Tax=Massilia sp. DWR3-1-1 TaxID=2804559 RepID=UPI003CEC4429
MIEPGFPTLLAYPALSLALGALLIGLAALALVRCGRARADAAATRYWRRLHLLSEVLLALGLIGLAVFAGRLTVAADQVLLDERVRSARQEVDVRLRAVIDTECQPARAQAAGPARRTERGAVPDSANLTPYNPGVAANDLCAIARARPANGAVLLDWQISAHALRQFGARYPGCFDNIFGRHNDCESTLRAAEDTAAALEQLVQALAAQQQGGAQMLAVQGRRDWGFALLAALLAGAGMAMRIARAAALLK